MVAPNGTLFGVGFTGTLRLSINDLPVTCGAFDTTFNGQYDGFVLALSQDGRA